MEERKIIMAKSRSPKHKRKSLRKEKHYTVADSVSKGYYGKYASKDQQIKHFLAKQNLPSVYVDMYKKVLNSPTMKMRKQIKKDGV
jgi:hypothetical protein